MSVLVGWALLHSLWHGILVAVLLALLLRGVRSSHARYLLASGSLILMLLGLGVALLRQIEQAEVPLTLTRAFAEVVAAGGLANAVASPQVDRVLPWLASAWMFGVALFYLWQLVGWISVVRLRRRGVCCAGDPWQSRLADLAADLCVARPVQLLESCFVDVPIVIGHLRPVILLPIGLLAGLPTRQLEAILLHELAHVRRHDYLVNILQRFAEGLLFYHPAVWWMSSVIRRERENCCDDLAVVAGGGDAHGYAAALAVLEGNRQSIAMAATGGNLLMRIDRLLYPKKATGTWVPFVATVALMLISTAVLPAWQAPGPSGSYLKWLQQDVVYIIAPAERVAYLKLTTAEECEHFIEQFWLLRDPTPGTATNEFKVEHYRRIAYANGRFEGWVSDRGRLYIVYGPPDEIESHPNEGREQWKYRYIEGVGTDVLVEFVSQSGAYRMKSDPRR